MAYRDYMIKVRIEFDDESKYDMMPGLLRIAARKLLTQLTMVADARRPRVMIESESFVVGSDEINLMDPNHG